MRSVVSAAAPKKEKRRKRKRRPQYPSKSKFMKAQWSKVAHQSKLSGYQGQRVEQLSGVAASWAEESGSVVKVGSVAAVGPK